MKLEGRTELCVMGIFYLMSVRNETTAVLSLVSRHDGHTSAVADNRSWQAIFMEVIPNVPFYGVEDVATPRFGRFGFFSCCV